MVQNIYLKPYIDTNVVNRRVPCMEFKGNITSPDLPDNKEKINTKFKSLY